MSDGRIEVLLNGNKTPQRQKFGGGNCNLCCGLNGLFTFHHKNQYREDVAQVHHYPQDQTKCSA